jgi:hypothetical protein
MGRHNGSLKQGRRGGRSGDMGRSMCGCPSDWDHASAGRCQHEPAVKAVDPRDDVAPWIARELATATPGSAKYKGLVQSCGLKGQALIKARK